MDDGEDIEFGGVYCFIVSLVLFRLPIYFFVFVLFWFLRDSLDYK